MEKYILLAEICFDWSSGEYSREFVNNIYLGCEEFYSEGLAKERAMILLKEYCATSSHKIDVYESSISVKKL